MVSEQQSVPLKIQARMKMETRMWPKSGKESFSRCSSSILQDATVRWSRIAMAYCSYLPHLSSLPSFPLGYRPLFSAFLLDLYPLLFHSLVSFPSFTLALSIDSLAMVPLPALFFLNPHTLLSMTVTIVTTTQVKEWELGSHIFLISFQTSHYK